MTSVAFGLGPVLVPVGGWRGVRWVLGAWPVGAAVSVIPETPPGPSHGWFLGGGLLAQAVLALVMLAIPDEGWLDRVEVFNALLALWNLIPHRLGGPSDGWQLLRWLRRGGEDPLWPTPRHLERLAERAAAEGSGPGVAWAELGRARARGFDGALPSVGAFESGWLRGIARWGRARGGAGALDRRPLDDHEAQLVRLTAALRALEAGSLEVAASELQRLGDASGPVRRQADVLGLQLAMLGDDPKPALARVLAWEGAEPLDPVLTRQTLTEVAQRLGPGPESDAALRMRDGL